MVEVKSMRNDELDQQYDPYGSTSGYFIENKGQWDPEVLFVGNTDFGKIGLTRDGMILNMIESFNDDGDDKSRTEAAVLRYEFSDPLNPSPSGIDESSHNVNFFIGDDPEKWVTGARCFSEVYYEDIWDGIDLRYYFGGNGPKYDLILDPYSDPEDIRFDIHGHNGLVVNDDDLMILTGLRDPIWDKDLLSYYHDSEEVISSGFKKVNENSFTFDLGSYDRSRMVVVDPLIFSTYVGGSLDDTPHAVDHDEFGNIIVGGSTFSTDFYTTLDAYKDSISGYTDAYIFKMKGDGTSLIYSTYIGGSSWEAIRDIHVHDNGHVYASGYTYSNDFPTTDGSYSESLSGYSDAFVLKLSSDMSGISASTYLGGSLYELNGEIEFWQDRVFVATLTYSNDYPVTENAYSDTLAGGSYMYDYGVTSMDLNLSLIHDSTYLGGTGREGLSNMYTDTNGNVLIMGDTQSGDFPVHDNAFKDTLSGYSDGIIASLSSSLSTLRFATYLGGSMSEEITSAAVDRDGNIFVHGRTTSADFPVTDGAFDTSLGSLDVFITKFDQNCSSLSISTFIGGSGSENPGDIFIDQLGDLILAINTFSDDIYITPDAHQTEFQGGWSDYYLARISGDLTNVEYSTYYGGIGYDRGAVSKFSQDGYLYIAGITNSEDLYYPSNVYSTSIFGENDTFVMKFQFLIISEPIQVYSLNLYSDPLFTESTISADLDEMVFVELIGLDSNYSKKDFALVNVSFPKSPIGRILIPLHETGNATGIYQGKVRIPSGAKYLEQVLFYSSKDPSKNVTLLIDKPNRPSSIISFGVFSDPGHTSVANVADKNSTVHIRIIGVDSDPNSPNCAFVLASSDQTITEPELIILQETTSSSGTYTGTYKVPGEMEYLEVLTFRSHKDPDQFKKITVNRYVFIFPFEDVTETLEDQEYYVQYDNIGWSESITWTFESDSSWISFDEEKLVLSGTPRNNDVGPAGVWLTAEDGIGHEEMHEFTITVSNSEPTSVVEIIEKVQQDSEYYLDFESDDEGLGDTTWHLWSTADWLTIDTLTGELSGIPSNSEVGEYQVHVWVDDGNGGKNSTKFNLTVLDKNDAPVIITTDITKVTQGDHYRRDYKFEDIDPFDEHHWELTSDAAFLTINTQTGTLMGDTGPQDVGEFSVNVSVIDSRGLMDSHVFTLKVENVNDKPFFIDKPSDMTLFSGEILEFDVNAGDYDGDDLEYFIESTPSSDIQIDSITGEISWKTSIKWFDKEPYIFNVEIEVGDGELTAKHRFKLTLMVTDPPTATLLLPIDGERTSHSGTRLEWEGYDPEGEPLTYDLYVGEVQVLVSSRNPETLYASDLRETAVVVSDLEQGKVFYWTVVPNDGGSLGEAVNGVFSFKVNSPPSIAPIDLQEVVVGEDFRLLVKGSDEDFDDSVGLTFSIVDGPEGMNIGENSGLIKWRPKQEGLEVVIVSVTDGIDTTKTSFTIEVGPGGDPSSGNMMIFVGGGFVVAILCALIVFLIIKLRSGKNRRPDEDEPPQEEQVIGAVEEEEPEKYNCDVPLTPSEAHAQLGKGTKKVSYEDLYGVPSPKKESGPALTTKELRDEIHKQIEELKKLEE
ncbi:MAG: putative Ig domain-containing protein [Thermoplasmatota archaeon]